MLKKFFVFILTALIFHSFWQTSLAQESNKVSIDKKIYYPANNIFVDDLTSDQTLFLTDQEVKFRIEVKNTGDKQFTDLNITSKLPEKLIYVSGPGSFDTDAHTLSFNLDSLNANESKTFEVKTKVKTPDNLKENTECIESTVEVNVEQSFAQDKSGFCISKQVLGEVKKLPATGPADYSIAFGLAVVSSIAAIYFTKKATK